MNVRLGIDAGGTKSILVAVDATLTETYRDHGPAIHAKMMPLEEQVAGVTRLLDALWTAHPDWIIDGLCVGVAGGGRAFEQERLTNALRSVYGFPVLVTSDAHTAHADAFRNGDGILVITGTGSMVLGRSGGRWERAGGYGFLIGDPAGGYRLGQDALFAICTAFDGGVSTTLTDHLAATFDIRNRDALILAVYDQTLPPASIAPLVLQAAEEGDRTAHDILDSNLERLTDQISACAQALRLSPVPVAVIGGLQHNALYHGVLRRKADAKRASLIWNPAIPDAAIGACRMIHSLLTRQVPPS
jgi:N-acetylglucosamine kinase-like BadF-type ATPase